MWKWMIKNFKLAEYAWPGPSSTGSLQWAWGNRVGWGDNYDDDDIDDDDYDDDVRDDKNDANGSLQWAWRNRGGWGYFIVLSGYS